MKYKVGDKVQFRREQDGGISYVPLHGKGIVSRTYNNDTEAKYSVKVIGDPFHCYMFYESELTRA